MTTLFSYLKVIAICREKNSHVSIQCIGITACSVNKIMFILTGAAGKLVNTLISLPTHSFAKDFD